MIGIIIVLCCSACGFLCGKYLEKRFRSKVDFFRDLVRYTSAFRLNAVGVQLERKAFDVGFAESCSSTFAEYLSSGKIPYGLDARQKNDLNAFFGGLNCVSTQELLKHIDYYSEIFAAEDKAVSGSEGKKAAMCPTLGILLGVMVGILFI